MRPDSADALRAAVQARSSPDAWQWLEDGMDAVAADRQAVHALFPAAGRKVGRGPLDPDGEVDDLHAWTLADAARALLLIALGEWAEDELEGLYRHGDAAERRAVLRALPLLSVGDAAVPLVEDALRTNDTRLIAAALGPYAFERLDHETLLQGILKCVFVGVPITPLEGLSERASPELARMLADYVHERVAAGRDAPAEVWRVIDRFPPVEELDAIGAELHHPVADRRRAARRALANRRTFQEW